MSEKVELRRGSLADLPKLEPVWISVHHRHQQVMPELAPYVDNARTWEVRSALYAELLAKPDTFLFLARSEKAVVGYGLAYVHSDQSWLDDTWQAEGRVAEIESLGVLPAYRGQGIGTRLFEALDRELKAIGVENLLIGVLPGNTAAIRLYRRLGFQPTWLYMSRLTDREPHHASDDAGPGRPG